MSKYNLDFPRTFGDVSETGVLRSVAEDFVVHEIPGWIASGEGEHLLLHIEKVGANTAWVAEQLAENAKVSVSDVGYCGMKDRNAVTRQWFSLYLPKREVDCTVWSIEGVEIIEFVRHQQKLRRGMHAANYFELRLRDVEGDWQALEQRFNCVLKRGVPNYFTEQRFGREAANLDRAIEIFDEPVALRKTRAKKGKPKKGGKQRGIYLSAARSWVFNQVLAERVLKNTWCESLDGESEPLGPMWGRGRPVADGAALACQTKALSDYQLWCDGLEHAGLSQESRKLQLLPERMSCQLRPDEKIFEVKFMLPVGSYATAVLRELLCYHDESH